MRLKTKTFGGKIKNKLHSVSRCNFLDKKITRLPLRSFWSQKFLKSNNYKYPFKSNCITQHWKRKFDIPFVFIFLFFSVSNKLLPNSLQISFFNGLGNRFCVRWCKSSLRHEKDEMADWSSRFQNRVWSCKVTVKYRFN